MVFVVSLDNNAIKPYGLLSPKGNAILRKGTIQRNVVSLLGIFLIRLTSIMSTPVMVAVMLILSIQ